MSHLRSVSLALLVVAFPAESTRADVFTITLPSPAVVPSTQASPFTFTSTNQPAVNGLLGYALRGNWTTLSEFPLDAYSSELRLAIQPPGGALSPPRFVGGLGESIPFPFGTFINNGAAFNLPGVAPPSFPAGDYTVNMFTVFPDSMAQVANGSVDVYSNPASVSGTTTGGPTFLRPDIGTGVPASGPPTMPYAVNELTVDVSGRYMFVNAGNYDTVAMLFGGKFNPLNTSIVINAGDYPIPPYNQTADTFVAELTAGVLYSLVSTGYEPGEEGAFTAYAAGPGTVTFIPVPEPGLTLLGGAAALSAGTFLRRRRSRSAF